MAFQEYDRTQSIQEMTARQLRLYISRGAKEANERMESLDANKLPDAMKDIFMDAASHDGKFLAGTSRMSKAQMQDYAQKLRDFNFLDTSSEYARDREYEQNFDRYEKFIKGQKGKAGSSYWNKFANEDGSVSKEGYKEYKEYINFVKGIMTDIQSYTYEQIRETFGISNIRKRFTEAKASNDPARLQKVEEIISEVYMKNKGKGMSSRDLNAEIIKRIRALDYKPSKKSAPAKQDKKSAKKVKNVKKKSKSSNNVKVKTGKKLKGERIREKQTTS